MGDSNRCVAIGNSKKLWELAALNPLLEAFGPFLRPWTAGFRRHGIIGIHQSCQNKVGIISHSRVVAEVYAEIIHMVNVFSGELRTNVLFVACASIHRRVLCLADY